MRKRVIVPALLLCLFLTACGGREEEPVQGRFSLLEEASGISEESALLTVDGREISGWRYLFWLAYVCDDVRERYEGAALPLDWTAPVSGGTLADYAKDQALANTVLYATVERLAEEYGCSLTAADDASLKSAWETQSIAHGGEAAYLAVLEAQGLNRARSETLEKTGFLYAKLCALCRREGSPLAPSEEELEALAAEKGQLTFDRILVAAGEDRSAAQARAAELFSLLNGAEDPSATFTQLAQAGDDPAGRRTVICGDGTVDGRLESALLTLEPGQFSGILESAEGFSILLRLPTEGGTFADEYFDRLLQTAAENAAVQLTEAYAALDTADFYQNLEALRGAKQN